MRQSYDLHFFQGKYFIARELRHYAAHWYLFGRNCPVPAVMDRIQGVFQTTSRKGFRAVLLIHAN